MFLLNPFFLPPKQFHVAVLLKSASSCTVQHMKSAVVFIHLDIWPVQHQLIYLLRIPPLPFTTWPQNLLNDVDFEGGQSVFVRVPVDSLPHNVDFNGQLDKNS